jgi:hypothetical protein
VRAGVKGQYYCVHKIYILSTRSPVSSAGLHDLASPHFASACCSIMTMYRTGFPRWNRMVLQQKVSTLHARVWKQYPISRGRTQRVRQGDRGPTKSHHSRRPLERGVFTGGVRSIYERQSSPHPECDTYNTESVSPGQALPGHFTERQVSGSVEKRPRQEPVPLFGKAGVPRTPRQYV